MDNKKRTALQAAFALIQNANFKGFFTGKIYTGATKQVCVPGLNCYSCPGAIGACPIGSLQNSLTGLKFKFPYYVLGLLIFFGALLGRLICGFLCPFGFLQDLIYKIPFVKKLHTFNGDSKLRYIKYIVLAVLVVLLPILFKLTPAFCKYICPSGTLSGVLLALADNRLFNAMGSLFTLKLCILIFVILISIVICRPFCKYLCPLGAFYGPFNKVSVFQLSVDKDRCTGCNVCFHKCDMAVNPSENPNSCECIRCMKCVHECPEKALKFKNSVIN